MATEAGEGMDTVTEELYALDPGDFVAARNELVRRLRKAGDKGVAGGVAKLRRPTPAAWAVNQLARRHRAELEDLVVKGEQLRAAQDRALAGAQAGDLRQAGRARREAVARLAERAEEILLERGGTPGAHAAEVVATLEAASLDAEAAAAVLGGRLSAELEPPSGFGVLDTPPAERPKPKEARPSDADGEAGAEPEPGPSAEELRDAEEAAAEARKRWQERSAKAREAVAHVEETRRAVRKAESDVARMEDELSAAERRRRAAIREAEQAEDAASRAEDAASRAAETLRAAEKRLAGLSG